MLLARAVWTHYPVAFVVELSGACYIYRKDDYYMEKKKKNKYNLSKKTRVAKTGAARRILVWNVGRRKKKIKSKIYSNRIVLFSNLRSVLHATAIGKDCARRPKNKP